jgi:hypothetical protein
LEGESLVAATPPPERLSLTPVSDDHSPEPHAEVTDAEVEMPLPSNPQIFFLGGIFALSVFATLYLASPIILPVVNQWNQSRTARVVSVHTGGHHEIQIYRNRAIEHRVNDRRRVRANVYNGHN